MSLYGDVALTVDPCLRDHTGNGHGDCQVAQSEYDWYLISAYGMACDCAQAAAGNKAASTTAQLHRPVRLIRRTAHASNGVVAASIHGLTP